LRVNQAVIIALLALAFVFNAALPVVAVAAAMTVGSWLRQPGFGWVYTGLFKPRGWVRPDILQDHPEPHSFAQGFGAAVVWVGALALALGAPAIGWALVGLVIALAALNLFAGFCAGCAVYYWLGRTGLPGFVHAPPGGIFPGLRPRRR
jgi:hypothetical protein